MPAYDPFDLALWERDRMLRDLERRRRLAERTDDVAAPPAVASTVRGSRPAPRGLFRFLPGRA